MKHSIESVRATAWTKEGVLKLTQEQWNKFDKFKLHREDGYAVEHASGTWEWYINGKLHREDGPAVDYATGDKEWYQHGIRHRLDGPAIEHYTLFPGRSSLDEWWINGKQIDKTIIENWIEENNINLNLKIDQMALKLKFG